MDKQKKENEETISISLGGASWNIRFPTYQILKDVDYDTGKIHCAHIENVDGNYVLFDYDIDFSTTSIGLYEHRYEMTGISNVRSMILTSANQGFFGSCQPFDNYNTIKVLKIDSNNYVVMGVTSSVSPQNTETGQSGSSTYSVMCVNMSTKTITQQFTKTYPFYLNTYNSTNVSYFPNERKIMFVCQKQSYDGYLLKFDDEITVEPIVSKGPLAEFTTYNMFYLAYLRDKVIVGEVEDTNFAYFPNIRFREAVLGAVLMTINNLETSVEKTADKTMKITYTIREVEE